MANNEQKYVSAERPVNLRTALKELHHQEPLNPIVRKRLAAAEMRTRFGLSLANQLDAVGKTDARSALGALAIFGSIIAAVAAIGLLLAFIQKSVPFAVAGSLGLLCGLAIVVREHRARKPSQLLVSKPLLLDAGAIQLFDEMLEQIAHQVPETVATQLGDIKDMVARIAQQASGAAVDEHFTMDNRMYLIECVRRYVPDTLQGFLQISLQQRTVAAIKGQDTAVDVLSKQLNLIQAELEKCELKITKSSAEKLLRQQRFLESKQT